MAEKEERHIGQFFVENNIITEGQLQDALDLQKDNKERLVGEILVTLGILTKEQLVMALEMYLMVTGDYPEHVEEWLDQDEIDMIMDKLK